MEPTRKTYQQTIQKPPLHSDLIIPATSGLISKNCYCTKTSKTHNHQKPMAYPSPVGHTQLHLKSPTLSVNAPNGSSLFDKTHPSKPSKTKSIMEELGKIKQEIKEKVKSEQMDGGGERDKEEEPIFVISDSCSGDGAAAGVGRRMTKVNCLSQIELDEFFSRLGARILAVDMPPFMQTQAVGRARNAYNGRDKFSSRALASALKKEFDEEYGAAWHCIVGTSFGSFVTHSVGGFLYFSLDYCSSSSSHPPHNQKNHHKKLYILMFKTSVHRSSGN